jgi:hypothetical protein
MQQLPLAAPDCLLRLGAVVIHVQLLLSHQWRSVRYSFAAAGGLPGAGNSLALVRAITLHED